MNQRIMIWMNRNVGVNPIIEDWVNNWINDHKQLRFFFSTMLMKLGVWTETFQLGKILQTSK